MSEDLIKADAVALQIENQKNWVKNQVTHYKARSRMNRMHLVKLLTKLIIATIKDRTDKDILLSSCKLNRISFHIQNMCVTNLVK